MSDVAFSGRYVPRPAAGEDTVKVIDFASLFAILRRRWLWVVVPTALLTVLAALASLAIPNYYWATAQVLIDPNGIQVIEGDLAPSSNSEQTAVIYAQNQAYIMGSTPVLMEVVARENLGADSEFGDPPPGFLENLLPQFGEPIAPERLALQALQQNVSVSLNEDSFVIDASVRSRDPQKAARLANAITEVYLDQRAAMLAATTGRAAEGLSAQLDALRASVEEGERAVQEYKDANGIIDADGRRIAEQRLAEINSEISRIGSQIAADEALVEQVARLRSDDQSVSSVAETNLSPSIVALRARLNEAVEEEATLRSSLGSRHPEYLLASARVDSVSQLLDAELDRFASSVEQRLARSRETLEGLQRQLAETSAAVRANNSSSVELRELERRAASARLVYEAFLLRTRQLAEQQGVISENPQVIATAIAPLEKSGPPRKMITGGAMVFGFLFGVGVAMLREQFGDRDVPAVPQAAEGPPVLVIPTARGREGDLAMLASQEQAPVFFDLAECVAVATQSVGSPAGVAVASSGAAEDSAFVALNLTIAAAKTGQRVLLVDAAPASGSLTAAFGLERHPGLNDVVSLRRYEPEFAVALEGAGFTVLPRGLTAIGDGASAAPRPNDRLVDWIAESKADFDLVVLDTGAGRPSALVAADGTVLVGDAGAEVAGGQPTIARIVRS